VAAALHAAELTKAAHGAESRERHSLQHLVRATDSLGRAVVSDLLFRHDRDLGRRYVCGADEAGRAAWAGPLVTAAVRFDYDRLEASSDAVKRLEYLNDSKAVSDRRRAMLLSAIFDLADKVAIVAVSAAKIDSGGGVEVSNMRALASALEAVALPESVNLVDWYEIKAADGWNGEVLPRRVEGGDPTSAAIAAASIVAKETRDQLMRGLDMEWPGYGLAAHKGYGGGKGDHETAIRTKGKLSPAHRLSIYPKVYAEIGLPPPDRRV
jgi:ribonuclease HII